MCTNKFEVFLCFASTRFELWLTALQLSMGFLSASTRPKYSETTLFVPAIIYFSEFNIADCRGNITRILTTAMHS